MGKGLGFLAAVLLLTGCGSSGGSSGGDIKVVAGENFWGSIAAQLGGSKVKVQSIVADPNADPHEYESSAADARAFAEARLVIVNGAGYDQWGQKLLDANRSSNRNVLNVAELLHKKQGDNPHFWYDPGSVGTVADEITAEYKAIEVGSAAYFDQQRAVLAAAFKPYLDEIAAIKQQHANTPIGATESIYQYMAVALGLNLTTPVEFMDAVAEGNDPPASAVAEFQNQISGSSIRALVYNVQTTTAVTTNIRSLAATHRIPTVGVSETLLPDNLSFQDWQLKQLKDLEAALAQAS